MRVYKRDGQEVDFCLDKIKNAIEKANKSVFEKHKDEIKKITDKPYDEIVKEENKELSKYILVDGAFEKVVETTQKFLKPFDTVTVEDISDLVEKALMKNNAYEVAKEFITYRDNKKKNKKFTDTEEKIISVIDGTNEQLRGDNANKHIDLNSSARDYIAGVECKAIAEKIIPREIIKAHKDGYIHWHDMDYSPVQNMTNCFLGTTEFLTSDGIKKFSSFKDGDKVFVKTKNGNWSLATVHTYGEQQFQKVYFSYRGGKHTTLKEIVVTKNHRWVLQDGTETTNLKVGDYIFSAKKEKFVLESLSDEELSYFCFGFLLGDGSNSDNYARIRLCGQKNKYSKYFKKLNFHTRHIYNNGDEELIKKNFFDKQSFLNCKGWRFLTWKQKQILFEGYYAADGDNATSKTRISTSDERLALMIDEISEIAGYYILSKAENIRNTNYKNNARLINYNFFTSAKNNYGWHVQKIESFRKNKKFTAWCLEEPTTHTFTLRNGLITGNCCLLNAEDMLVNGFQMGDIAIHEPKKVSVAGNLLAQIQLICSGQQYGGQTASISAFLPIVENTRIAYGAERASELSGLDYSAFSSCKSVDEIYRKYKKATNILKRESKKQFKKIVEKRTKQDIHVGIKTYAWQILCHHSSNGQSPFTSLVLNLREAENERELEDLAFLISEVLDRRIKGVKGSHGETITPLFPKLLYWTCDGLNVKKEDPYYYLTKKAAECITIRMAPDINSEKMSREIKSGQWIPSMGAARGDETVSIRIGDKEYINITIKEAFEIIKKETQKDSNSNESNFKGKCGVYKITHIPTKKWYIGSSKDIGRRITEHRYSIRQRGTLGEQYFMNDFDIKNYHFEIIKECNIDNLWEEEKKYIFSDDDNCVNLKDPRNIGNYHVEIIKNCNDDLCEEEKKPICKNKGYTWFKKINRPDIQILSRGNWETIYAITKNDEKSTLKMYEISYDKYGEIKKLHITEDHPLHTQRGRVRADELKVLDEIFDAETFEPYKIVNISQITDNSETYDFEVSNDMFDLSGILSHNCRSWLTPLWIEKKYPRNTKFHWQEITKDNKKYKNAPNKNFNYFRGFGTYSEVPEDKEVVINFRGNSGWVKEINENEIIITEPKVFGRWNNGVISCNISLFAGESREEVNKRHDKAVAEFFPELKDEYLQEFWKRFDEGLELCHRALLFRDDCCKKIKAKNSPLLWMHGGFLREQNPEKTLGEMMEEHPLWNTISLGFVGLYETSEALLDKSNTTKEGQELCISIMKHMNDKIENWKEEAKEKNNLTFNPSIYGTPEEQLTHRFALALKKHLGVMANVTDHDYVTNSYHVNPGEQISWKDKLEIEGKYLSYCKGGAVSYIETDNLKKNPEVVEEVIRYMNDYIAYAEVNTTLGTCFECNYQGDFFLKANEAHDKYYFECPNCHNTNQRKMDITMRLCGYIGKVNAGETSHGRMSDFEARQKARHIKVAN